MKKLFKNILIAISPVIVLHLIAIGWVCWAAANDNLTMASYASNFDKHARLDSLQGQNRVVIIGGSNARFSIHSDVLQEQLQVPVVNMGLHVGLGLNFMFEEVFHKLHCGDVLVVAAEYQHYVSKETYYGDSGLADMLLMRQEWLSAFGHIYDTSDYIALYRLTERRMKRIYSDPTKIPADKETRQKFNMYGDYVGHYNLPDKSFRKSPVKVSEHPANMIDMINNQWVLPLQARGVKVLIAYPPLCQTVYDQSRQAIEQIHDGFTAAGWTVINTKESSVLPDSKFYDSPYHLKDRAGIEYTENLRFEL